MKIKSNKKGFTLVELIVVITIMTIMLGAVTFGVIGWIDWSNFKRQNEIAENIFVCAQNQLTRLDETGQLTQMDQKLLYDSKTSEDAVYRHLLNKTIEDGNIISADGKVFTLDKSKVDDNTIPVFPESMKDNQTRYQSDICYVIGTKEDYQAYLSAKKMLDKNYKNDKTGMTGSELNVLYDIIEPYIYDTNVLNAVICLEFTPSDGQVFAVLYSDLRDGFEYNKTNTEKKGTVDISDRTKSYRKSRMTGYYGVDSLSKATSKNLKKPVISSVQLSNDNTLNLSFRLSKITMALDQLSYEIKIINSKTRQEEMSIYVPASKLKNKDNKESISCKVIYYAGNENIESKMNFYAWIEGGKNSDKSDSYIKLVLDGADLGASDKDYETILSTIISGTENVTNTTDFSSVIKNTSELDNTFSIFRMKAVIQYYEAYKLHHDSSDVISNSAVLKEMLNNIVNSNIYCTVQGSGELYKTTTAKSSNTEHACFAGAKLSDNENVNSEFNISNARHLYNIRFVEEIIDKLDLSNEQLKSQHKSEIKYSGITYKLEDDIVWSSSGNSSENISGKSGIYDNKQLFMDGKVSKDNYFTSIKSLSKKSELIGNRKSSGCYIISGLNISEEFNNTIYENAGSIEATGLFKVNNGKINNVNLDSIKVSGKDKIGSFCGINRGELSSLEVMNSNPDKNPSIISGQSNVGGVFGFNELNKTDNTEVIFENLVNRASVTGKSSDEKMEPMYIGGITGQIVSEQNEKIEIKNCKNYGKVTSTSQNAKFIGGITGYANNSANKNSMDKMSFVNCTSSMQYTSNEIQELLKSLIYVENTANEAESEEYEIENKKSAEDYFINTNNLCGYYVGGIIGYNKYASISGCNTSEENNKDGYVIGNSFVGGIVGFNEGFGENGINGKTGTSLENRGVNSANVIGMYYVGGISGCNTQKEEKNSGLEYDETIEDIKVSTEKADQSDNIIISNWVNSGIVFAVKKYAGGITGYNTGIIRNCFSEVSDFNDSISIAQCILGDYAGGIVGYNNGNIDNEDNLIDIVCNIGGRNYVGGVAGYNDVSSDVSGYRIVGGYITGSGTFVGGYAGLNASENLISEKSLYASPNRVEGKYCVGGVIGGNIANLTQKRKLEIKTDNFLGELKGTASVGGFVGFNSNIGFNNELNDDQLAQKIESIAQDMTLGFKTDKIVGVTLDGDGGRTPAMETMDLYNDANDDTVYSILESVNNNINADMDNGLIIGGKNDELTTTRLGSIYGQIFVGGVIGYNTDKTSLTIENVQNYTPITAVSSIETVENINENDYKGDKFQYSYVGGIIGKVSHNVLIKNCSNEDLGIVTSGKNATYTGGICEINNGIIQNCHASSVGDSNTDYVGGIAGLNLTDGKITGCTIDSGKSITGKNYTGGIVSENYGLIENVTIGSLSETVKILSSGDYTGGVAGYNYSDAVIRLNTEMDGEKITDGYINVELNSDGKYAGGATGKNDGDIKAVTEGSGNIYESGRLVILGSIYANEYAGGAIGYNTGIDDITNICNKSVVTAFEGMAGGIAGYNEAATAQIINCVNSGVVTAAKNGVAGGIVSVNEGIIKNCGNYGHVESANSDCGGITGRNKETGKVINCRVNSIFNNTSDTGIWWKNNSDITDATKNRLTFTALNNTGGICAVNEGVLEKVYVNNISVCNTSKSNISNIGAISGDNKGSIHLFGKAVNNSEISTYTTGSYLGGVAGNNSENGVIDKLIENNIFENDIFENNNKKIVIMDKAEINADIILNDGAVYANMGGVTAKNSGSVINCKVTGNIISDVGTEDTGYGGIAGINNETALIKGCSYDAKSGDGIKINDGSYVNGILLNGTADNIVVAGGISGINYGKIENSVVGINNETSIITGKNNGNKGFGFIGGIVGTNYGSVISCNNADNSNAVVNVINYAGHTGGITAFQKAGAIVSGTKSNRLSTGKKWNIVSKYFSNDCGCGGILGYSASGQDIEYVDNYAAVKTQADNSDSITSGGIIGRFENLERTTFSIKNTDNYGTIIGSGGMVSGFIARTKYSLPDFENCTNYGLISSEDKTGKIKNATVAGFIGSTYLCGGDGSILTFSNCKNYGNVNTNKNSAAGFFASNLEKIGTVYVRFSECVNEGSVRAVSSSDLASGFTGAENSNISFYRCRNYGNDMNNVKKYSAFTNRDIVSNENIIDSFNISNANNITGNTAKSKMISRFYSLSLKPLDEIVLPPKEVYIDSVTAKKNNGSAANVGDAVSNIYDNSLTNRASFNFGDAGSVAGGSMTISFDQPYNLANFGICWAGNVNGNGSGTDTTGDIRVYTYNVSAKIDQNKYYLCEDGNGGYTWIKEGNGENPAEFVYEGYTTYQSSYWNVDLDGKKAISSISIEFTQPVISKSTKAKQPYVCFRCITADLDSSKEVSYTNYIKNNKNNINDEDVQMGAAMPAYYGYDSDLHNYYINIGSGYGLYKIDNIINSPSDAIGDTSSQYSFNENNKQPHQKFYEEVDPKIYEYYINRTFEKPTVPQNVTINNSGGVIKVNWENADYNYDYNIVRITVSKNGQIIYQSDDINVGFGINYYMMDMLNEWSDADISVSVTAVDVNSQGDSLYSEEANAQTQLLVKEKTPKMHIELANASQYVIVWDNIDEYADGTVAEFTVNGSVNKITKKLDGINYTNCNAMNSSLSGNKNYIYKVKGRTGQSSDSETIVVQSITYGIDLLKNYDYIQSSFNGFYGNTPSTLYNEVSMKNNGTNGGSHTEMYVNTELVLEDYKFNLSKNPQDVFNCNLVVSNGESHVTHTGVVMYSRLGNLSDDLLTYSDNPKITVRSYPWCTQNYITYFGYKVIDNISEDELVNYMKNLGTESELRDYNRKFAANGANFVPVFYKNENGSGLNNGYILRLKEDGNYEILYTPLLDSVEDIKDESGNVTGNHLVYEKQIDSCTYTKSVDNNGKQIFTDGNKKYAIADTPVLDAQMETTDNTYTVTWDKGLGYSNAEYLLQFSGLKLEEQKQLIELDRDNSSANAVFDDVNKKIIFTDSVNASEMPQQAWDYDRYVLNASLETVNTKFDKNKQQDIENYTFNWPKTEDTAIYTLEFSGKSKNGTQKSETVVLRQIDLLDDGSGNYSYTFSNKISDSNGKIDVNMELDDSTVTCRVKCDVSTPVCKESTDNNGHNTYTYDYKWSDVYTVYKAYMTGENYSAVLLEDLEIPKETYNKESKTWTYTFVNSENNWNYNMYVARVVRKGLVAGNNVTTTLPTVAKNNEFMAVENNKRPYAVKLKLSQITRPVISLKKNESGIVEKDSLFYDLTWNTVPQEEREAVEKYEIKITDDGNINDSNDTLKVQDKYLYIKDEDLSKNELVTQLDLNNYPGDHKLKINVRAIAKSDNLYYRSGVDGVISEFTMPVRLSVPRIKVNDNYNLTATPLYQADSSETMETLDEGVNIIMTDLENTLIQGKYQIAVALYDKIPENTDKTGNNQVLTDWASGSEKVLIEKGTVTMTGDLSKSKYTIPEMSVNAGKWLKVAIRAISDSRISSEWSDEDADGLTQNYLWIQVPRMQLNTPVIKENGINAVQTADSRNNKVELTQKNIYFEEQKYADGYKIELINKPVNNVTNKNWIYLEKNSLGSSESIKADETKESEWCVYVSSSQTQIKSLDETKICSQDAQAVYVGKLTGSKDEVIDILVPQVITSGSISLNVNTLINYNKNLGTSNGGFNITLPEVVAINGGGNEYHFINKILVQSVIVNENDKERYAQSDIYRFTYNSHMDGTITINTDIVKNFE